MPKIRYEDLKLGAAVLATIDQANVIIAEYEAQGFDLTLRQLYYQFVARDLLRNRVQEYKRLGDIVQKGRRAGLIDWNSIVDRTRYLRIASAWESTADIVAGAAAQYRVDLWANQKIRVEVWIEKDALVGVFEGVCDDLHVGLFSCRGYTSDSEAWAAAMRLRRYRHAGQTPVILHFGDHDPSGIDMTRDITDRLELFTRGTIEVRRLALNMDQVDQYGPPPNPAKETDSRYAGYIASYGNSSWELDALEPAVLADLVRAAVEGLREHAAWDVKLAEQAEGRRQLDAVAQRWDDITEDL